MRKKSIIVIILLIVLTILAYGIYYVNDYYHADDTANQYLNGTGNVTVTKLDKGLLLDGPGNDTALIFYPGAKVEYTSYLPMLTHLSERGVDCYLVEMPFNLAFLGKDLAGDIIKDSNYEHYYLSGHSLGGTMAAEYANNSGNVSGLILFAAYSTKEIDKPVLSIYGSNDKVLNHETYNESRHLIDRNLTEIIIDGGNHAQVGNYGSQPKDGKATITPNEQQKKSIDAMVDFINKLN